MSPTSYQAAPPRATDSTRLAAVLQILRCPLIVQFGVGPSSDWICASGEKVISSPAARNVFRFWTNADENPLDWKCKTRKGKSLRRKICNWLPLRIERTHGVQPPLLAPERNRPPREKRFPGQSRCSSCAAARDRLASACLADWQIKRFGTTKGEISGEEPAL
jgi:hypothetical protein